MQTLSLSENEISDLSALTVLPNLSALNLAGNKISDSAAFSQMPVLEQLVLDRNRMIDLAGFAHHPALWSLSLEDNQITDVSPLAQMPELRSLLLCGNPLDYAKLLLLNQIDELALSYSAVSHPEILQQMTWLNKLYFRQESDRENYMKIRNSLPTTKLMIF